MEIGRLPPQRVGRNAKSLVAKLSKFKPAFALSSSAYCAVHWLLTHNFSVYMVSGALLFGAVVATSLAWLSGRFSSAQE
jgi:hypothetical protein